VRSGNGALTITFDPADGGCAAPVVVATPRFTG
jgi:hypothetical protein